MNQTFSRRTLPEVAALLGGQAAAMVASLLLIRQVTDKIPAEEFGIFALAMTIAGLANQLSFGPIANAAARTVVLAEGLMQIPAQHQGLGRALFLPSAALVWILIVSAVIGPAILHRTDFLGMVALITIFAAVTGHNTALSAMQNALRLRAHYAAFQALEAWLRCALALLAFSVLSASASTLLGVYLLAASVTVLLRSSNWKHTSQPDKDAKWRKTIFKLAWPYVAWGGFTWLQQSADRWSLNWFSGASNVGQYAVLYQLGTYPLAILTGITLQTIGPILFRLAGDGSDQARVDRTRRLGFSFAILATCFSVLGASATYLLRGPIKSLFLSKEYSNVAEYLPLVVLSSGLFGGSQILALVVESALKPRTLVLQKICCSLVGIIASVMGAKWFGIWGVSLAGVVFSVTSIVWTAGLVSRLHVRGNSP